MISQAGAKRSRMVIPTPTLIILYIYYSSTATPLNAGMFCLTS